MRYIGNIFRPPSEAYSLIVQVTVGCSHNTCAFCSMYKDKHFGLRPLEEVLEDLEGAAIRYRVIERIFLADGDALIDKTENLLTILRFIQERIPSCKRVTCYASPSSILLKSEEDLRLLRKEGLTMLYMGLESGNDQVLNLMRKGHDQKQIVEAGKKARSCGFALSVTAITGLGGTKYYREHAIDTAKALNEMNPEYIGLLTLMVEPMTPLYDMVEKGEFTLLSQDLILEETELLIQHLDSPGSVFRMNHASNYLNLRGTLNHDKENMLEMIRKAKENRRMLKPESFRAL